MSKHECRNCGYPYAPNIGHCPNCKQSTVSGMFFVWIFLIILMIGFLLQFLEKIGWYSPAQ